MTDLVKIIGAAFVTAIAGILLKNTKPELSFAVTVTGIIVILLFLVDILKDSLGVITEVVSLTGIENGLVRVLLKIVGIGYLTEFSVGILQDFGVSSVADKVSLAGKLTILVLSLPVVESLLLLLKGFLQLV